MKSAVSGIAASQSMLDAQWGYLHAQNATLTVLSRFV